ncbi:MAG: hypothetical protein H7A46_04560 [Verrucomicrobiales bacterium]|nr:hypothetical protein [Verrucomicrobiales bacterium]
MNWTLLGEGTRIAGGWELTPVSLPAEGTLRARGWATGGRYNSSTWYVESYRGGPLVLTQPLSRIVDFAAEVAFEVVAKGSEPLAYQWWFDGTPLEDDGRISGSHAARLMLTAVSGADAGNYSVRVSNASAEVTSTTASLTVAEPLITGQPTSQTGGLGGEARFEVVAVGSAPLRYQWWKDGMELPGETEATLLLSDLTEGDAGEYAAIVTTDYGAAASQPATLTVANPPMIIVQPAHQRTEPGGSLAFEVLAVGAQPLGYQWWKDGEPLVGETASSLELGNVQVADAGWYQVSVANAAGEVLSDAVALSVNTVTRDLSFRPNASGAGIRLPHAIGLDREGNVLVGAAESATHSLVRIHPDGTLDDRFDPNPDRSVTCLAIQSDGRIVLGGLFKNLCSEPRIGLGRIFSEGGWIAASFRASRISGSGMCPQWRGRRTAGSWWRVFHFRGNVPRQNLARLNADGSLDLEFDPGLPGSSTASPSKWTVASSWGHLSVRSAVRAGKAWRA